MVAPDKLAAMSILVKIIACALVTQSPLMMPLIYTMVNLSSRYGNSSKAPFGYVWYGCTLCWTRKDIELGYQLGRLAMDVMGKFKARDVETTVRHQFNSFIRHWCEHERHSIHEFPLIVQTGKETGDVEYGTYVAVNYITNLLLIGEPLANIQEKQQPFIDWVASTKFSFSETYGNIFAQATQCLMGQGHSAWLLQGDFLDEQKMIPEMERTKNNLNLFAVYSAKTITAYFHGSFSKSADFAQKAELYEAAIGGLLPVTQVPFYGSLALLQTISDGHCQLDNATEILENYKEKLSCWSEHGPMNFRHKYDLVEAEKARIAGRIIEAEAYYEKAIKGAGENKYIHEEALAYELAAEFYYHRDMMRFARIYMQEAHNCYTLWGATGKVKNLQKKYPQLLSVAHAGKEASLPEETDDYVFSSDKISQLLDVSSLLKATRSLSAEVVLKELLKKIMAIMFENAGAQKGLLIMQQDGEFIVELGGSIDLSEMNFMQPVKLEDKSSGQQPASIIRYVARTYKNLVLNDASSDRIFGDDQYVLSNSIKSVLCAPITHLNKLTGIIYLENNLATGVFTPSRLSLLNVLSAQAAISIENARLYATLEDKVAIRTRALREQHQYLQAIVDGVDDPIMVIKEDYTIELMNSLLYKTLDELLIANIKHPKCYEVSHHRSTPCDENKHPCPLKTVIKSKKNMKVVHKHHNVNKGQHYVELSASPLFDDKKNCIGIIESVRDITNYIEVQDELREQKKVLDFQAHHDVLTELPNRILFSDRLKQGIEQSKRNNTKMALLFIDLDHFKEINDSLGHDIGDEVLKIATQRLEKIIRDEDTLARLGGDEFTILLENLTQGQDASLLAQKVVKIIAKPININEHVLYISSSIGISLYPDDSQSAQDLLKYADAAMYKAKDEGRSNFQYYSTEMTEMAFERIVMETNLRTALKKEEFIVYYQPQVNGKTGQLIGMEALVRWQHPTMGLVSPAKFIPLAESTGLIIELDQIVMKVAMKQMANWYNDGLNPGVLALNLAIQQLQQKDFISILDKLLIETQCKPHWLELEVTEGQIMTNPEEAITILKSISDLGIELAIDDFGTGYSSLAYLKKLPINKLKIDQSFVKNLPDDNEDAAIAKAVIALAQSLNLRIIAEGVETKEQEDFLLNNGCKNIQGYFYSKPIPADKMEMYLKKSGFMCMTAEL